MWVTVRLWVGASVRRVIGLECLCLTVSLGWCVVVQWCSSPDASQGESGWLIGLVNVVCVCVVVQLCAGVCLPG